MSRPVRDRLAGAPISWGVCEVPGWGWQLPASVVLTQLDELGLAATEFGPDGFLPDDTEGKVRALRAHGLRAVGQFVPIVLHDSGVDVVQATERAMHDLVEAGASTVVIAAATGRDGYDTRPTLDDNGWLVLARNLDRLHSAAVGRGLRAALHPHVGTMIQTGEETQRVLDASDIGLCLDTGHLLIGGADPVVTAQSHPDRIVHCHLKDVRRDLADAVRTGQRTYADAVADGMYVPLGRGDVDIAAIVRTLEASGYDGWYVLEQDTVLPGDPAVTGLDPRADVAESIRFVLDAVDETR